MARYRVRFLKDVLNDTGHLRCILQRAVEVDAQDGASASVEACAVFCLREGIGHWRDHADKLEVCELEVAYIPLVRHA